MRERIRLSDTSRARPPLVETLAAMAALTPHKARALWSAFAPCDLHRGGAGQEAGLHVSRCARPSGLFALGLVEKQRFHPPWPPRAGLSDDDPGGSSFAAQMQHQLTRRRWRLTRPTRPPRVRSARAGRTPPSRRWRLITANSNRRPVRDTFSIARTWAR